MARKNIAKREHSQLIGGGIPARGDVTLAKQETKFLSTRVDDWADIVSGARTSRDPRSHGVYSYDRELPYQELERMYRRDALSRRIVDKVPQMMTRDPWTIQGNTDNGIWQYLEKRLFNQMLRRGLQWGNLYGGGIVVIGADDGRDWEEPLNIARVKTIEFFRVYDRYSITGTLADWNSDPRSARFGQREWYTVYPRGVIVPTASFRLHHTRVIQCDGMATTDVQMARNYGWSDSILNIVYNDIRRYISGLDDSSAIIRDFMQSVLEVGNLQTLLSTGQTGSDQWKRRVEMMDLTRHTLNMMVLGGDEKYNKQASSVAGLPDLLDRLMMQVCQSADMPATVLFGRSVGGMNASGDNEIRMWYDSVDCMRRERIAPAIQYLGQLVCACQDYDGEIPEGGDIHVEFPPMWKLTLKEQADSRLAVAQADHIYIQDQVLSPDEVAVSRFGGDSYSVETILAHERNPEKEPEPPEPVVTKLPGADDEPGVNKDGIENEPRDETGKWTSGGNPSLTRAQFENEAGKRNNKTDIKKFLGDASKKFTNIVSYRKNFLVEADGALYAYMSDSRRFIELSDD